MLCFFAKLGLLRPTLLDVGFLVNNLFLELEEPLLILLDYNF